MLFWIDKILKTLAFAIFVLILFLADAESWIMIVIGVGGVLFFTISGSRDNIKHNIIYRSRRNFIIFLVAFAVFSLGAILSFIFVEKWLRLIGITGFLIVLMTLTSKDFLKSSKKQ